MSRTAKNLTGLRFGRLAIVARDHAPRTRTDAFWRCVCDCGVEVVVRADNLRAGTTSSCGCYARDLADQQRKPRATKKVRVPRSVEEKKLRAVWGAMVMRCHSPWHKNYEQYGARGITVCDRWRKFENFVADMGYPPSRGTIERVNNNKDYTPDNCVWASMKTQARNRRNTIWLEKDGVRLSLAEWCEVHGVAYHLAYTTYRKRHPV